MKKITFSLIALLFLVISCNKQDASVPVEEQQENISTITKRGCAAYEVLQDQLAADPGLRIRMEKVEEYTKKVLKNPSAFRLVNGIIEIPVVVHVIYRTAQENISDDQINSQIAVLNADFQNVNTDKSNLPANSFQDVVSPGLKVSFILSQTIRKSTNVRSWTTNDAVKSSKRKGDDAVDPTKKLNIWVCNLSNGILGYAQFPGGNPDTDGLVILYSAFGSRSIYPAGTYTSSFDLGRTATHEAGHWMNLRHIWGDDNGACTGSDLVTDTPNQGNENYGNPIYPQVSCDNGPKGDMFMNYMDYTNDKSMYMFSVGQKDRMLAIFSPSGPRVSYIAP